MTFKDLTKLALAGLTVGVLSAGLLVGAENAADRLKTAGVVFTEIMGTPDRGIPQELLENSQCIVIVPGMKKAAFIVGGNYGRGFIALPPKQQRCRNDRVSEEQTRGEKHAPVSDAPQHGRSRIPEDVRHPRALPVDQHLGGIVRPDHHREAQQCAARKNHA